MNPFFFSVLIVFFLLIFPIVYARVRYWLDPPVLYDMSIDVILLMGICWGTALGVSIGSVLMWLFL